MDNTTADQIKALRSFNRTYTRQIGVLDPYLGSDMSLTEVRVLYELAHRDQPAASEIVRDLALDAAYLSRILKRFETRSWLQRVGSVADGRQQLLRLTDNGHAAFAPLQQKSRDAAAALLGTLPPAQRTELIAALATVQRLIAPSPAAAAMPARTALLRELRPGDMGWVVEQHGALYAREYGFTSEFEALVAEIAANFLRNFQPDWENAWIAEVDGQRAGSIFVVRKSPTVAQLRMLLLTPAARGMGLGGQLTDACIAFARAKGYRKMSLWTQSNLTAARAIYAARGFQLKASEPPSQAFGQTLVSETWELKL